MTTTPTRRRATVTYFPFRHGPFKDDTVDYTGDVIDDNADFIVLLVYGSEMTFSKNKVIISPAGA